MIFITNKYYQYIAHHLSRYVVHHIVTLNGKRILIMMIQIVVIQIFWSALVPYYVLYGRKYKYTPTLIFQSVDL